MKNRILEAYQNLDERVQRKAYTVSDIAKIHKMFLKMTKTQILQNYIGEHEAVTDIDIGDDFQIENYGIEPTIVFYSYIEDTWAQEFPCKVWWFGGKNFIITDN